MKGLKVRTRESLYLAGVTFLVIVALPLAAALALVGRLGVIAVFATAVVVGVVLYAVSPRFREWLRLQGEPVVTYNGLSLDNAVSLSPAHAWARIDGDEATVGADDLMLRVLGPVESVDLPAEGRRVERGEPLFRLCHGERDVEVLSPVSGTVVHSHWALEDQPARMNGAPFDDGWAVRLAGDEVRRQRRGLLRGNDARTWFRGEVDRLFGELMPADALPTLPDGGVMVDELHRAIDDATWKRLQVSFFAAGHAG
jgi:glycine cleavage system H protein